jgi:hypothetical protein
LADASFQQVDVFSTEQEAAAKSTADLVLIPTPVKVDQSMGVTAWSKNNFTLVLKWTARERTSQNIVWLKTIDAEATEKEGNAFTGAKHNRILMQKLFDDLSLKTYDAIKNAPELRFPTRTADSAPTGTHP